MLACELVLHVTTPPEVVVSPVHEFKPVRVVDCPEATVMPAFALINVFTSNVEPVLLIVIFPVLASPIVSPALFWAAIRLVAAVPPNTKFPLVVAFPFTPKIWKRAEEVAVPPKAQSYEEI